MKAKQKKPTINIKDLLLLFVAPVSVVLVVAAILYVPRLFANPQYDFIYSVCYNYDCDDGFGVDGRGRIVQHPANHWSTDYYRGRSYPTLYYYDSSKDSSQQVTFNEANKYTIDKSSKSPDGYVLELESSGTSGFLLWSSSGNSTWYLKDGLKKKPLSIGSGESDYGYDVKLVGWVKK